mgnify:CR=1 FL=1
MNSYSKIVKPNTNKLIHDHTNLVKKISWHLHGRVNSIIDIEDIIQLGMVGLINAAQNYVPQKDDQLVMAQDNKSNDEVANNCCQYKSWVSFIESKMGYS